MQERVAPLHSGQLHSTQLHYCQACELAMQSELGWQAWQYCVKRSLAVMQAISHAAENPFNLPWFLQTQVLPVVPGCASVRLSWTCGDLL